MAMISESVNADPAIARRRLLVLLSTLLESLYEPAAVSVLATLQPGYMQSGGGTHPRQFL